MTFPFETIMHIIDIVCQMAASYMRPGIGRGYIALNDNIIVVVNNDPRTRVGVSARLSTTVATAAHTSSHNSCIVIIGDVSGSSAA